jgi:iron complex outermembrane receptor protein
LLLTVVSASLKAQQLPTRQDSIVVTGVYAPVPLEEVDRPVRSIDLRSAKLLFNSVTDALQLDPSVDLRERAPNGVQTDVSIRGGTFGQTLVLLNGFRVNDAQTGHHNMDIPVPLEAVSRLEILRGSGSTMYGSDAVGGVINLITRPPEASELVFRSAVGNFGVNQESASLTLVRQKVTEQVTFARDFSSGFRPDRDYRSLAFSSTTHLSSSWGPTDLLVAHSDRPFGADGFYGNFNSWEQTRTWFAGLRQKVGKATEFSFTFRRHGDLFVLLRDHPEVYTNHHTLQSYQAAVRRQERLSKNSRLFYGVEGYRDAIVSNNLGNHVRGRLAGYLTWDVRAWRRFSFSAGVREETYRTAHGQFSPALSAGYWLNAHAKLRGEVSKAFRIPSLTDLYYHDPANQGSPLLRPERTFNSEAGLDWNAGKRLSGDLTVFQRNERDGIDYARSSPSDIWRAINIQQIRFRGVETSLGLLLGRSQHLDIRYTHLRASREQLPGSQSRYVFNHLVHSGVASWQSSLPHSWMGRIRLAAVQRYGQNSYFLGDLYLAQSSWRVRPFLQLRNVTNTSYEEILGVPMPGRSLVAGLEVSVFSRRK